jgi:hypothetical protein
MPWCFPVWINGTIPIAITKPRKSLISWWFTGFHCVDLACVDRFSLFWHWFAYLLICKMEQRHKCRRRGLQPVNHHEMRAFLGLVMATGIVKKPSIESYWETSGITETENFRDVMPRNRFQFIRYLHCSGMSSAQYTFMKMVDHFA